jgi:hypothetical protein
MELLDFYFYFREATSAFSDPDPLSQLNSDQLGSMSGSEALNDPVNENCHLITGTQMAVNS